jgi:NAD(P)-dependent dehydrogenase (short-subunit alcohol dehydrogenase family)
MKLHYFPTPAATNTLPTEQLRETFLIGGLFRAGAVIAHYTDLDRMIVGAAVPFGRMAKPEEIAHMAVFLASSEADYVVAQTYNVDGGNWMS